MTVVPGRVNSREMVEKMSHKERIVSLAESQKLLAYLLIGLIVAYVGVAAVPPLFPVVIVGVILFYSRLIQFMRLVGIQKTWFVLCCIGLFVPLLQFLILAVINYRASEIVRAAGLRVGAFGVTEDELVRFKCEA